MSTSTLHNIAQQLVAGYLPPGWERVAGSDYARVARNSEQKLYFKAFVPRSPARKLSYRVRGSPAKRAQENARALLLAGFDAPHTVERGELADNTHYLFMTCAEGQGIDEWLHNHRGSGDLQARRQLLRALGLFIGRLHASGFIHGDLQPDHIIVRATGRYRFTLVNNEGNRRQHPPSGRALLCNRIQLNTLPCAALSRTDRLRVFNAWQRQMRSFNRAEAKLLATQSFTQAMQRQSLTQ